MGTYEDLGNYKPKTMKKIIIFLLFGVIIILSCKQECKDITFNYYTIQDTILIPELTLRERVCDTDLEMLEGTPQYFSVKRGGQWVLRCYNY